MAMNFLVAILSVYTSTATVEREDADHTSNNIVMDKLVDDLLVKLLIGAVKKTTFPCAGMDKVHAGFAGNLASPFRTIQCRREAMGGPLGPMASPHMLQPVASNRESIVAQVRKGEVFIVRQPKPIGVQFQQKSDGIFVKAIDPNTADERIRKGDKLLAVSASFGNEIWNAESLGQTMSALNTRIGPVYMKFQSSGGSTSFAGLFQDKKDKTSAVDFDDEDIFEDASSFTASLGTQVTIIGGLVGLVILAYLGSTI